MRNVRICLACADRQHGCRGACVCKLDGKDILEHAASGYCPRSKLGLPDQAIEEGWSPENERARLVQGGCCGEPSAGE